MRRIGFLFLGALWGCTDGAAPDKATESQPVSAADADEDGWTEDDGDCNDADASIHPSASEICNALDDNCDDQVDEGVTVTTWRDADGDGFGDTNSPTEACEPATGYVNNDTDCDDGQVLSWPGNVEVCDGLDNNCDTAVDEGVAGTFYPDNDGDGYGDPLAGLNACEAPVGYLEDDSDCDDNTALSFPGNPEACDGLDNNCDGVSDEGVTQTWYVDADADGYGDGALTQEACLLPAGYAERDGDCDDTAADIHPDAAEVCNNLDDNCDGVTDTDAADLLTWYADADADGHGDPAVAYTGCEAPLGYVSSADDCDDAESRAYPGSTEVCDGVDNDCDGYADLGALDAATWYQDNDGDGYGYALVSQTTCDAPSGYVASATDCNDGNAAAAPGQAEACDGVDNDCDGATDEDDAIDAQIWYTDLDGDTWGDAASMVLACDAPSGTAAVSGDCDDTRADVSPSASEVCDTRDNDCDSTTDEPDAIDASAWYADADGDGYGSPDAAETACDAPAGSVADDNDCDDNAAAIHPGALEVCDGVDNNCDGSTDGADASGYDTFYADADGDGYGGTTTTNACSAPSGFVSTTGDCDDTEAAANPVAPELCDGIDNNCDGDIDTDAVGIATWYADTDGDGFGDTADAQTTCSTPSGYVRDNTDCDDQDNDIYPGADEFCDGEDTDCDGVVDDDDALDATLWYLDTDGDGFGDPSGTTSACAQPSDGVTDATDCDDTDAAVYPDSHEIDTPNDGIDTNCDGADAACTDLNCDGWPDLVFSNYYDGASYTIDSYVYYGSESGYSSADRLDLPTKGARGATVADLNHDGYQDIVFIGYYDTNYTTDSYVYWGSSSGHSTSDRTALSTVGAIDVAVADLDSDGWEDLVFAGYYSGSSYNISSYVYWGSSTGYSVSDRTALATQGAYDVEVADIDGDGYSEILFASYRSDASSSSTNSYLYWGSSAGYSTADRTSLGAGRVPNADIADIDGDGILDIHLSVYYDGDYSTNSYIYWGSGTGYSSSDRQSLASSGIWDSAVADLDGDDRVDVAMAGYADGASDYTVTGAYVYFNSAAGFSTSLRDMITTYGARMISAEDLDLDGFLDLVVSNQRAAASDYEHDSYVYWGSINGYSTSDRTSLPTEGSYAHAVGDLDGDGWPEIVFSNYNDNSLDYTIDSTIYWGSSTGFSTSNITSLPTAAAWGEAVIVGAFDE